MKLLGKNVKKIHFGVKNVSLESLGAGLLILKPGDWFCNNFGDRFCNKIVL